MAGTSKFIKLHDQILVEYIYTDSLSPTTYNTSSYGIEVLTNGYNGTNYVFSSESSPVDMGNIIGRSALQIGTGSSEYVYLDNNLPVPYNDHDTNLTASGELLQNFLPDIEVVYDSVRIHLMSGFNFDEYEGFLIEIFVTRTDLKRVNLLSLIYKKGDNYEQFNPKPLLVADRLYTSYIDIKIPAVSYFIKESKTDTNSLHARITRNNPLLTGSTGYGVGIVGSSVIDVSLSGIYESRKNNSFTYFKCKGISIASINKVDEFDKLVAYISEADGADYFEMYGKYNGVIFSDFMIELNNIPGNQYVVFHEYVISEQIDNTFVTTSYHTEIQNDNWDKPIKFRPIIENSYRAVSYVIDYTMRLMNGYDNSQILKKAQYISTDVKKYGPLLPRINLGLVPTIAKVYNNPTVTVPYQITVASTDPNSGNTRTSLPPIQTQTEYIGLFIKTDNIKVTTVPIKIS